jgi:hypothetical protein
MTQGKLPLTTALRTDLAKIAALVNERHGIVIPPDDPAWAIVTMNELPALALRNETLRMIDKLMAARIAELRTVLAHAEKQIGQAIDAHVRAHLRRQDVRGNAVSIMPVRRAPAYRRYFVFAAAALAIFAYGFWMGRI